MFFYPLICKKNHFFLIYLIMIRQFFLKLSEILHLPGGKTAHDKTQITAPKS